MEIAECRRQRRIKNNRDYKYRKKNGIVLVGKCLNCGKEFVRKTKAKFCSDECKKEKWGSEPWRNSDPKYNRSFKLKKNYGITIEERDSMILNQGGVCAICRSGFFGPKGIHVDHDHSTGKIRGILCSVCNAGLGFFKDSKHNLAMAIKYLMSC